ncbi:mitochondrial import inner membrane translocase subunit Tim29 [Lonchura striata]
MRDPSPPALVPPAPPALPPRWFRPPRVSPRARPARPACHRERVPPRPAAPPLWFRPAPRSPSGDGGGGGGGGGGRGEPRALGAPGGHAARPLTPVNPVNPFPPAALWLRSLLRDYSSSLQDAARSARRRPALTALTVTALTVTAVLARSVPDGASLESAAVAAAAALSRLPPGSRSPRAERRVQRLLRLRERGRLRVRHLGLLSVAAAEPDGSAAALYRARCPYLRPRPWESGALLDVGFAGRWWLLDEALREPDVNDEEFGHLPEPLRRMNREQLRSERNERLHRERRRRSAAVLGGDDIGEGDTPKSRDSA